MIDRVEERFAIKPQRLVGDTNYGVAAMLGWLVDEKRIAPYVPMWDKSEHHDGTFSRSDFVFDSENNRYICPAGKHLKPCSAQPAKESLPLPCQLVRLPRLSAQAKVLSQHGDPKNRPLPP